MMKRSFFGRILPLFLTVSCAAAIFMFSRQSGVDSTDVSDGFLRYAIAFWKQIPVSDVPLAAIEKYTFLVRKLAHFSIYCLLGIFSYWSAYGLLLRLRGIAAFTFCVLYAVSDELHQLFSKGRSCSVRDVCIDSAGAFLGIVLACLVIHYFVCKRLQRRTRTHTEKNGAPCP